MQQFCTTLLSGAGRREVENCFMSQLLLLLFGFFVTGRYSCLESNYTAKERKKGVERGDYCVKYCTTEVGRACDHNALAVPTLKYVW